MLRRTAFAAGAGTFANAVFVGWQGRVRWWALLFDAALSVGGALLLGDAPRALLGSVAMLGATSSAAVTRLSDAASVWVK